MPHNGAIIFSDLIGKLDAVRVTCERRGRNGRYRLESLIAERGPDVSVPDWVDELTADCSVKQAQNWSDRCAARCPDLQKVLLRQATYIQKNVTLIQTAFSEQIA